MTKHLSLRMSVIACALCAATAGAAARSAKQTDLRRLRPVHTNDTAVLSSSDLLGRLAKADTLQLLGGPGSLGGKFEDVGGQPDWQGWTSMDRTVSPNHWHTSNFNCANLDPTQTNNRAWWVGEDLPSCTGDLPGGYGPDYDDRLQWSWSVSDTAKSTTVRILAQVNVDAEPGYDFLALEYFDGVSWSPLSVYDGVRVGLAVEDSFTVGPGAYGGPNNNEVKIRWHFQSDNAWDSQDCMYANDGGAQIDLIRVYFRYSGESTFTQVGTTETAEIGSVMQWVAVPGNGAGDFSQIWSGLGDMDFCRSNSTPQIAFVDDGSVTGTSGYAGQTWTYGPGGNIVHPEGGLLGPRFGIANEVWSPVMSWPAGKRGGVLRVNVYHHEELGSDFPWILYHWFVRGANQLSALDRAQWVNDGFEWYGAPRYSRRTFKFTNLIAGLDPDGVHIGIDGGYIQIALGIADFGPLYGAFGTDGTPAPYFDNVSVQAFSVAGPSITARISHLAQDAFPESGALDGVVLAANNIRFDSANSISLMGSLVNDPGDSITCHVAYVAAPEATLPTMHYRLNGNADYDGVRTSTPSGVGNTAFAGEVVGTFLGEDARPDNYFFDLPDSGFFFPGDVIHYFFRAEDSSGGIALLPSDTTGFDDFGALSGGRSSYEGIFEVRGLPSSFPATAGDQPPILYWDDAGSSDIRESWLAALDYLGMRQGVDFDVYSTNDPGLNMGNGLGGRASLAQIDGYTTLLYSSGWRATATLNDSVSSGVAGDDVSLLDGWLRVPSRNILVAGNHLIKDLLDNGGPSTVFVNEWLSVSQNPTLSDLRQLIGDQSTPTVAPILGNPVFAQAPWTVDGDCPARATFDAIVSANSAATLAEFLDPGGSSGVYPYSAATLNLHASGTRAITIPYDLYYAESANVAKRGPWTRRAGVLGDILQYFGHTVVTAVADDATPTTTSLSLRVSPNPLNPRTTIHYTMPDGGRLIIELFNINGRRVTTILDAELRSGRGQISWLGTDDRGNEVASGVYLLRARGGGSTVVDKVVVLR